MLRIRNNLQIRVIHHDYGQYTELQIDDVRKLKYVKNTYGSYTVW